MPNFVFSLAGSITALALSLVLIYQIDNGAFDELVAQPPATEDVQPTAIVFSDAMPGRSPTAAKANFTERSRGDLHVTTIGAYEYEPSVGIRVKAVKHETTNQFKRRTWYSLAPPTPTGPSPVVILFHGADRSGLSMLDMWQSVARDHGVVLIAPNSAGKRWPYSRPDAQFLEALLTEIAATTPINREKVFLFGHSSGAVYAQIMVNRKTGPWRAAATHGGFASSEHLASAEDAKPFRMYIGSLERSFPVAVARQMGKVLADAGHETDLVVIPFQTHWFYDSGPKIAEDAWAWFAGI